MMWKIEIWGSHRHQPGRVVEAIWREERYELEIFDKFRFVSYGEIPVSLGCAPREIRQLPKNWMFV